MMRFSFLIGSYLISAGVALPQCLEDPVLMPKLMELAPAMMECQEKSKINFAAQKGPSTPETTAALCNKCPDLVVKLYSIQPRPACVFNGVDVGAEIASLSTSCSASPAQPGPEAPSASPVSPAQPTPEAQSGPPPSPVPSPMPTTPRSMVTSPSSHPVFAPSTTPTNSPNKHHEAQSIDNSQDGTAGSSAGTSKVSEFAPASGNSGNLKGSSGTAPTESSPVNSKGTDEVDDSKVTTSDDTSKTESSDSDKSDALTSSQNPSESTATDKHAKDKKPNNAPTPFSLLLATTATTAVSFALFFFM
ncbi:hypothetical protein ABG067_006799 [Albugo candida]